LRHQDKREKRRSELLKIGYPNPLDRARCYQVALAEQGASYRTVALQFNVTREEVCHYVTLLKRLPADVRAQIDQHRDLSKGRIFSLRKLLEIARMPTDGAKRRAFSGLLRSREATFP